MTLPINAMNPSFFNKMRLPLNLQFFSEPPEGGENPDDGGTKPDDGGMTQEEIDKKIESESDRKLQKALEKKEKEWEGNLQDRIDQAIKEKERLSNLSEKERKDEELSTREKDLENRLKEIERKELKADAVADLKEKGLPSSFAEYLLADDAEGTLKNINEFKTAFDEAVNASVKEKLRQDTPLSGNRQSTKGTSSIAEIRNKQDQSKNKAPDLWA